MSYRYAEAAKLIGEKWVGSHECVALVQHNANAPTTLHWKEGAKVRGASNLSAGVAIATFSKGRYGNRRHGNHAAFYISQDGKGIWVVEQFRNIKDGQIAKRYIPFRNGVGSASNDGDAYSVIE